MFANTLTANKHPKSSALKRNVVQNTMNASKLKDLFANLFATEMQELNVTTKDQDLAMKKKSKNAPTPTEENFAKKPPKLFANLIVNAEPLKAPLANKILLHA